MSVRRGKGRLEAAAALLAAALLLGLGVPVVIADLAAVSGDPVARQLRAREPVSAAALERLAASRAAALAWRETPQAWSELGLARLALSQQPGAGDWEASVRQAEAALTNALALAPADPYAWTRLAYARYFAQGATPQVADTLVMAVLTGPNETGLLLSRAELALRVWTQVEDLDRTLLQTQLRKAWPLDPPRLAAVAAETGQAEPLARAIVGVPGALATLAEHLSRQIRQTR